MKLNILFCVTWLHGRDYVTNSTDDYNNSQSRSIRTMSSSLLTERLEKIKFTKNVKIPLLLIYTTTQAIILFSFFFADTHTQQVRLEKSLNRWKSDLETLREHRLSFGLDRRIYVVVAAGLTVIGTDRNAGWLVIQMVHRWAGHICGVVTLGRRHVVHMLILILNPSTFHFHHSGLWARIFQNWRILWFRLEKWKTIYRLFRQTLMATDVLPSR